jgi:hypothetical protein
LEDISAPPPPHTCYTFSLASIGQNSVGTVTKIRKEGFFSIGMSLQFIQQHANEYYTGVYILVQKLYLFPPFPKIQQHANEYYTGVYILVQKLYLFPPFPKMIFFPKKCHSFTPIVPSLL